MTGILFFRQPLQEGSELLCYRGSRNPPNLGYRLRLCFEAALPESNWYSLGIVAWISRKWGLSHEAFTSDANRAFEFWRGKLGASSSAPAGLSGSADLYSRRMEESVRREAAALADQKGDPASIRQVQLAILEELRQGKSFRNAHHEGGTNFFFDGKRFVRETYGEEEGKVVFETDDELLKTLREFYDWESMRETSPHRPPELEVWRFIQKQLLA